MLGECVGDYRGRFLIDVSDHTHFTHTAVSLSCSRFFHLSLFSASMVIRMRSMFATPIYPYVGSKLGHLLWIPIGGPSHTSSGWLSVGLWSISTVHRCSACQMTARRTVAVSERRYLACRMRLTCPSQLSCDLTMCD